MFVVMRTVKDAEIKIKMHVSIGFKVTYATHHVLRAWDQQTTVFGQHIICMLHIRLHVFTTCQMHTLFVSTYML